jgi:diketogulonate reductase-like aldo/keto reductase
MFSVFCWLSFCLYTYGSVDTLQAYSPLGSPGSPGYSGPSVLSDPIVTSVAEKLQKTPAQVALRWGLHMGQSVLPKSANERRIKENFDIFDWSIPHDLMAKFSAIKQACTKATFSNQLQHVIDF